MILTAQNLCKTYGAFQLIQGVCLEIPFQTSIAIIGKSGSGKSTLLHMLGTLLKPTSGSVEFTEKMTLDKIRQEKIGFVFQSFHLIEEMNVLDNVLIPMKIARKKVDVTRGLFLLQQVGLEEKAYLSSKLLSGGEKQRVCLARALCNNPDLLLVDEPTGSLDEASAQRVKDLLFYFVSQNKSIVLVTHDEEFALLCDQVFLLKEGVLHPYLRSPCTKN